MSRADIVEKTHTDTKLIELETTCPMCGKKHTAVVPKAKYELGKLKCIGGALVQNAFPSFSADVREMFITGICPSCWEKC